MQKSDLDFWIDWEGIPPTVDWWKEIEKGIEEADLFLFLISPDSAKSKVCGQEIECAVKNGKRLIPLLVRETQADQRLAQLSHLNFIYFRENDGFDTALQKLLAAIHTDYEWVQQHRWLQVRALDWERDNKDSSSLLRGKDLEEAEFQLATNTSKEPHPTDLQREYVFASKKVADRQRRITVGISIAGVIALAALAIWGWGQAGLATLNANESERIALTAQAARNDAEAASTLAVSNEQKAQAASTRAASSEQKAINQAQIALARQWAAEANAILASPNGNSETAALLSLRAFQLHDVYVPSADAALVASLDHLLTTKIFNQHDSKVSAVAYSPNGNQILIGYIDGTAKLYDINTGEKKSFEGFDTYPAPDNSEEYMGVKAVAFSEKGNYLLVAGADGHILVWNLVEDKKEIDLYSQENLPLWSAKFSPNEKYILIGTGYPYSGSGNIYLFERESGQLIPDTFEQLRTARFISDVEFSQNGNLILSTSFDKTAILWEMDWNTLKALPLHTFTRSAPIRDGAFSADGNYVLLGSDNNTAELFSVDGVLKKQFIGHTNIVYSVNFSPIAGYILTGSWDNTARLWDIETAQLVRTFAGHTDSIHSTAFSPDGKYILTGSFDKTARQWNADPTHDTRTIYGHSNRINSVSYSADGKTILSSSSDKSVRLWNAKTLELESLLSNSMLDPTAVFSTQGQWIAAKSGEQSSEPKDLQVILWKKVGENYEQAESLPQYQFISSLLFSAQANNEESKYLLLGTSGCDANLLEVGTWQFIGGYYVHCWNNDIAITAEAEYIAVAGVADVPIYRRVNNEIRLADCQRGSSVIAFSQDGKYLAVQIDNVILIWDWRTTPDCSKAKRLSGHSALVSDLVFSPDGKYLLSASKDGTAILWDAETWGIIRTLAGHEGDVVSAAFSPDSKFIVTGSSDKTIRVWDVDFKNTIEAVCFLLQRDFTQEERTKYGISDNNPTCEK